MEQSNCDMCSHAVTAGFLEFGDFSIACYVLDDERRLLDEMDLADALFGSEGKSGLSKRTEVPRILLAYVRLSNLNL